MRKVNVIEWGQINVIIQNVWLKTGTNYLEQILSYMTVSTSQKPNEIKVNISQVSELKRCPNRYCTWMEQHDGCHQWGSNCSPSEPHELTPVEFVLFDLQSSVQCFVDRSLSFFLTIVLSVLPQFTESDYLYDILKLFIHTVDYSVVIGVHGSYIEILTSFVDSLHHEYHYP